MQLFLTDETNMQPTENVRFFVYGGLIIPMDHLSELSSRVERIREEAGYGPTDTLKFDTHSRPEDVSFAVATEAKNRVVQTCLELDCKFIVHLILHDIIRNQDPDRQLHWAINYVLGGFNYYLREVGEDGICLVDTLPVQGQWQFLSEKFSQGLTFESGRNVLLERIKLFGASCINASHAMSATDIVLGSFRYCINNPQNPEAASQMMLNVIKMTWHRYDRDTDTYHVNPHGFIMRPNMQEPRWAGFRPDYDSLRNQVRSLLARGNDS